MVFILIAIMQSLLVLWSLQSLVMTNSTLADAYIDTLSFGCYDLCVVKKGSKTLSIMNLCVDLKFFFLKKKKERKKESQRKLHNKNNKLNYK